MNSNNPHPILASRRSGLAEPGLVSRPNILNQNWHGQEFSTPVSFSIELADEAFRVTLCTAKNPVHHPLDGREPFLTGLWEYDVFELFLRTQGQRRYTEINLGSKGSWWTCLFDDYRKPAETQPSAQPIHFTNLATEGWHAAYTIPYSFAGLPEPELWSSLQIQVTAIQYTGETPNYLAWNAPVGRDPDFHYLDHLGLVTHTIEK